jgi:hypothetical protein
MSPHCATVIRMKTAVTEAYELLDFIYCPSVGYKRLIKRDQSAPAKQQRDLKVTTVTTNLRARSMEEQAEAIELYHSTVDEYVDGQQAVDLTQLGSAIRDDGLWLTRLYDHARTLLAAANN